jgi:hypothetical protein
MTTRLRAWLPALIWAAIIFVLSSVPGSAYPATSIVNADKLVHLALYGLLAGLCARGFVRGSGPGLGLGLGRVLVLAALLSTLYGITDELHQSFVPGRNCDWHDVVADAAGSVLGAAFVVGLAFRRRRGGVSAVR